MRSDSEVRGENSANETKKDLGERKGNFSSPSPSSFFRSLV